MTQFAHGHSHLKVLLPYTEKQGAKRQRKPSVIRFLPMFIEIGHGIEHRDTHDCLIFDLGQLLHTQESRTNLFCRFRKVHEEIVLIVGGVVSANASRIIETGALIMVVVMCHNLFGYALGFLVAKALHMDMAKVKAVSIEVGMQNSGLATSLALLHFGAAAAIPGALFSVWHNISGSLAANYLAARMKKQG